MRSKETQLTFGITGMEGQLGGFTTESELSLKVRVPATFKPSDLKRMSRDCEILKEKLDKHPKEMGELLALIVAGRLQEALPLAKRIKLTEEDFGARQGGLLWLAVAVGAAVLLWPKEAH